MLYVHRHKNYMQDNLMLEANKYSPSNEMMLKTPPAMREQKQKYKHGNFNSLESFMNLLHQQSVVAVSEDTNSSDKVVAITFCNGEEGQNEMSVMIESPLNIDYY